MLSFDKDIPRSDFTISSDSVSVFIDFQFLVVIDLVITGGLFKERLQITAKSSDIPSITSRFEKTAGSEDRVIRRSNVCPLLWVDVVICCSSPLAVRVSGEFLGRELWLYW